MHVFLLLLDGEGEVVTRERLFDECWAGALVGDDSLNRAIAQIRRALDGAAPGALEIETIPRTGYQLKRSNEASAETMPVTPAERPRRLFTRRAAAASAGAAILAGGAGFWALRRSRAQQEFDLLMSRGLQAVHHVDPVVESAPYFRRALALRPDHAPAHGLLAYALAIGMLGPGEAKSDGASMQDAERAAREALRLDPAEPNARLALTLVQRPLLDLAGTEDRLRAILTTDPDNVSVMRHLWGLLQTVGRSREAHAFVERAMTIMPLAAGNNYPLAQMLWIRGRTPEADRVIERAIQLWPSHRFVRFARFTILAFTDRPQAALEMLDSDATRPPQFTPESVALWRISLAALEDQSPAKIARARDANLATARQRPELANQAVMVLSALGELDAAFEAADRLLLFRSRGAAGVGSDRRQQAGSMAWRFVPWLFTPPATALHADPRFAALCDGTGLSEYWAKQGTRPDYPIAAV